MTKNQRLVLVVSILASFVAFLDGSIVNVALPAIEKSLGGGLASQQWYVDAYLLTLGSLILIAGSMSDLFGRVRIVRYGLLGFALTSLLCAIAPNSTFLIIARALQGVAGALLVPSSLALIISSFKGPAQSKAIGSWTAWTGISFIIGPLLGGFMIDVSNWRLIFIINIIPVAVTLYLLKKIKIIEPENAHPTVDFIGALLCGFGLGALVYALIEQPNYGWGQPRIVTPLLAGIVLLTAFIWREATTKHPMLPLKLFRNRNFSVGNIATTAVYAGLTASTFVIIICLQQIGNYTALQAGASIIPVTLLMFFLSPRFGALAGRYGPRLFMALGPVIAGCGFLVMLRTDTSFHYATQLLPGLIIFGIGLSMTVAPLTSAVLGSIPTEFSGIASAVNNAIARIAGLIAVAMIGLVIGTNLSIAGFHRALITIAALLILGGLISLIGIKNPRHTSPRTT